MPGVQEFWLFVAAAALLNVTPGPDMALVAGRGAQMGARGGIAAALGVGAGCFVHIAAAALGLSAMLASSAWAFAALKWIGAAYLVIVGLTTLRASFARRASDPAGAPGSARLPSLRAAFAQGFLTNALNPKVALFFLAFLPQFIDPAAPSKIAAFLILGLTFNAMGTAWNVAVALIAARAAGAAPFRAAGLWLERALGLLFVGLGVRLALSERP